MLLMFAEVLLVIQILLPPLLSFSAMSLLSAILYAFSPLYCKRLHYTGIMFLLTLCYSALNSDVVHGVTFPSSFPSSLLPYLHMLMDPLVSALNGSQTLISQGLRTLELCVDNLQPDFLYDHIQPVRAELMQALWQTLHNPDDAMAAVAYRVLGKFGGSNRKMLSTPQPVSFNVCSNVMHLVLIFFLFPFSPSPFSLSSLPPCSSLYPHLFPSPLLSFPLSLPPPPS